MSTLLVLTEISYLWCT